MDKMTHFTVMKSDEKVLKQTTKYTRLKSERDFLVSNYCYSILGTC